MMEAGCVVIGGHSVRDPEIKFGYAVTGMIDPQKVWANANAQVLDSLILTKGLGTGVISTAIKRGEAKQAWIDAATKSMTTLNARAAEVAASGKFTVHAATDVTGFGLIGHAREMAAGSGVSLRIDSAKVPLLEGAMDCVRAGFIPGGLKNNREFAECLVGYEANVPEEIRTILFDPQTAGGLLLSVARSDADSLVTALNNVGVPAVEIGEVLPQGKPLIRVV
jgi:selenide,water dikinase